MAQITEPGALNTFESTGGIARVDWQRSPTQIAWARFKRDRVGVVAGAGAGAIVLFFILEHGQPIRFGPEGARCRASGERRNRGRGRRGLRRRGALLDRPSWGGALCPSWGGFWAGKGR